MASLRFATVSQTDLAQLVKNKDAKSRKKFKIVFMSKHGKRIEIPIAKTVLPALDYAGTTKQLIVSI